MSENVLPILEVLVISKGLLRQCEANFLNHYSGAVSSAHSFYLLLKLSCLTHQVIISGYQFRTMAAQCVTIVTLVKVINQLLHTIKSQRLLSLSQTVQWL